MKTKINIFLICILFFAFAGYNSAWTGTTGKITGRVIDATSGEALPGASVIIEGTTLGAATDIDGNYFILNVPPGVYELRAQMIGYTIFRIENIRVSIDLTTEVNFSLEGTVLEGEAVTIVAERPLVQPDITSSLSAVGSDEIEHLPVQEMNDVLELQAGLVKDATGGIHVRGGRSGEVAYWIDGVAVTDVYSGNVGVAVENSSIEELQVVSGTFNAEYGQAMSGIVNIVTKVGGSEYKGEITGYVGDYIPTGGDREFGLYKPFDNELSAIRSPSPDSVEQINPLSDFNNIYNLQGSLSGPVPFIDKLTFFANARYFSTDGYRYGMRWFTPQGNKGDEEVVPMEPFRKYSGQLKLSYSLSSHIKLTYNIMGNYNKFRWYDRYYKYNPDGDFQRWEKSINNILGLTHVINSTTFYDLKLTYFDTEYKHHVYPFPLKKVVYDSTTNIVLSENTYVHPDSNNFAPADWSFQDGGMKMQNFIRNTKYYLGKFDLTSQITKRHEIKAGFEVRYYDLTLEEYDIIPKKVGTEELIPFQPEIPKLSTTNHNDYQYKPVEFAAYIQDKMEFKDMIVNLGVRFDYFDANGKLLADPKDTDINNPFLKEHKYVNPTAPDSELVEYTLAEKEEFWWKDTSPKYKISPRFGIAYPVTDRGIIHFSYGHFFQMPSFRILYGANDGTDNSNPDMEVSRTSGLNSFLSNANLEPQKTVMYEIGLQQQLSEDIGMDITLFYRDIRDWVGSSPRIDTYLSSVSYTKFENKDYSNVRGVTLTFNKRYSNYFEASLDYTYMVAEGTASNPQDEYNDRISNRAPRIQIIPLGWDQRHTFNGHISIGKRDWRVTLLGRYWTGTPYTPTFVIGEMVGASSFSGLRENSSRKPDITTFDLRLHKDFYFGGMRYTIFTYIYNLLDARGQTGVYDDTGNADYTLNLRNASSTPRRVSILDDNAVHTEWYIEPRQVQVGVSIGF